MLTSYLIILNCLEFIFNKINVLQHIFKHCIKFFTTSANLYIDNSIIALQKNIFGL